MQANDTLWKISRTYNVSVDDLKRWNSVDEKNLRTGWWWSSRQKAAPVADITLRGEMI